MVEIPKLDEANTLGAGALRPYANNLSKALSKWERLQPIAMALPVERYQYY